MNYKKYRIKVTTKDGQKTYVAEYNTRLLGWLEISYEGNIFHGRQASFIFLDRQQAVHAIQKHWERRHPIKEAITYEPLTKLDLMYDE